MRTPRSASVENKEGSGPVQRPSIYQLLTMTTNRLQQLSEAHSWLSEGDIRLLLAHNYLKFSKEFTGPNVQQMLDNYTTIASRLPEHDLRNQLCRVKEFCN